VRQFFPRRRGDHSALWFWGVFFGGPVYARGALSVHFACVALDEEECVHHYVMVPGGMQCQKCDDLIG
jgi:hypothetical protein